MAVVILAMYSVWGKIINDGLMMVILLPYIMFSFALCVCILI